MYILSTPGRLRRAEAHRAREGAGKGPPAVCLFLVKKNNNENNRKDKKCLHF